MLYVVATPIGNLEDITLRAARVLGEVDFVLAEDTRKTGLLLKYLGVKKKLISFYEHKEIRKISRVIESLKSGKNVALVSSAGTPTISDPGYKLVRECRRNSIPVTSLPGPSSVINALALTSIPHDKFIFLGYISRKRNERKRTFEKIKGIGMTAVFFESPFRLVSSLKDLKQVLGAQQIALAREMTKKFEEILELSLDDAINHFSQNKPKGEFVLVVECDSCFSAQ